VISAVPLGAEFFFRISCYVDFAPELPLGSSQGRKQILQAHCANNQQIDVALGALFTPCNRAIDRGPRDLGANCLELGLEQRNDPCRFRKQIAEFRENRGSSFCSEVDSPAFLPPSQDPAFGKGFKFSLEARWRRPKVCRQFGKIPGPFGREQCCRQDLLPNGREKGCEDRRCTHFAYIFTQNT
jgi:hypothetical protein